MVPYIPLPPLHISCLEVDQTRNCSVHLANEETHLETRSDFLLDFPKLLKILSSNCSVCVWSKFL